MTIFDKLIAVVCTLGAIWWILVIISCIRDWVKAKIQQDKENYRHKYIYPRWYLSEDNTPQPPPAIDWKKRYQDVQEMRIKAVDGLIDAKAALHNLEAENKELREHNKSLSATFDKSAEMIQAQMAEITKLRTDIQERYEQAKEVHVWAKDQAADFNNLRDVAVKLEQENERLRAKLGMDSLAPSANKSAPEPHTKLNI